MVRQFFAQWHCPIQGDLCGVVKEHTHALSSGVYILVCVYVYVCVHAAIYNHTGSLEVVGGEVRGRPQ